MKVQPRSFLSFHSSHGDLYSLGLDLAFLSHSRLCCWFLVLAVVLDVKAKLVCVGACPYPGQMLCKFSFVLSVEVFQHAAFLFIPFKYCARSTSAELNWEPWCTLKKTPLSDLHTWLLLAAGFFSTSFLSLLEKKMEFCYSTNNRVCSG